MTENRLARGLSFFATLLVVFALNSAGAPMSAAAQGPADQVDFSIYIAPRQALLKTLCVGQSLTFYVSVERHIIATRNNRDHETTDSISGVGVRGTLGTPSVGTLKPDGLVVIGMDLEEAASDAQAVFTFKAKKPGSTSIKFAGAVERYWLGGGPLTSASGGPLPVEDQVVVQVKKCKAKVSGVNRWSGAEYLVLGTMNDAELTADEDGHFTGTGTVTWVTHAVATGCITTDSMAPSEVDMTGQMDDDGRLIVQLNYQPAIDSATIYCAPGGFVSEDRSWTVAEAPQALSLLVPSSGGVVARPQDLVGAQATVVGQAVLSVIPESEETTSFQPNRRLAGLSSAGAPSLGTDLLALIAGVR